MYWSAWAELRSPAGATGLELAGEWNIEGRGRDIIWGWIMFTY